ncbi:MAG: mandelate racemase/muconate lactonizing enzyme family protein [Bacteroidota bacterium]
MPIPRRNFVKGILPASLFLGACEGPESKKEILENRYTVLDEVLSHPILKKQLFSTPVLIDSLELLRYENQFICRVKSTRGAEGICVSNHMQMQSLYPIFLTRLQPFFLRKDARELESLLDEVYVFKSNYKLQNLALWVPLATIEFALLDMLGKIRGVSIGELIGDIHHTHIAVYQANNFRGQTAQESLQGIQAQVEKAQARALKFKVGGRMSKNQEFPSGRTEKLIPLVRETFGPDMTIYADSNGSYTPSEAIRIGKLMEEYAYDFYEEPVPFDWYEETLEVADSLTIPIAGGEQEPSLRQFRWLIANDALQIVQPDLFYFGGMIRSMKVARMAAALGKECTPHISGSGLGYLYMMHFVSAVPNAGPYHEFKGFNKNLPLSSDSSDLTSENGVVQVPTGPGLGIEIAPDFLQRFNPVTAV